MQKWKRVIATKVCTSTRFREKQISGLRTFVKPLISSLCFGQSPDSWQVLSSNNKIKCLGHEQFCEMHRGICLLFRSSGLSMLHRDDHNGDPEVVWSKHHPLVGALWRGQAMMTPGP